MTPFLRSVARHQCGVFTHAQALRHGMSQAAIHERLAAGDWLERERNVYIGAGTPITVGVDAWTAVLAVGPPVALAGRWAAWAHDLDRAPDVGGTLPEVVVPLPRRDDLWHSVSVHRTRQRLEPVFVGGLPSVSAARAVRQMAAGAGRSVVRDVVHHGLRRRRLTMTSLSAELGRGRSGAALLRSVLEEVAPGYEVVWEGRLHRELAALGVALTPQLRVPVPSGYRLLDLGDGELRFGVEVDGFLTHLDRFASDRRRDRELWRAGWLIVHVAVSELAADLAAAAREVVAAYHKRRRDLCA